MQKTIVTTILFFLIIHGVSAQHQLWGSASQGGLYGNGFLYKTDSIGDNLHIVHQFKSSVDGENISALTLASNNKLYGVASAGGTGGTGVFSTGTLFEYDLATDQFTVLENFGPNNTKLPSGGTTPRAEGVPNIVEVSPGILFILMYQGRYVFQYNVATGEFTKPFTLPSYQGGATNGTLQNKLNQAFYKASNGMLYVTTQTNSSCPIPNPNMGSIIRVNPTNNTLSILHKASCDINNGYAYDGFVAEANSKLYSTTQYGGVNNKGIIYEYNLSTNTFLKLHDFAGSVYNYAVTSLVFGSNGKLYGTAHGGGIPEPNLQLNAGGGVLFEFDLTTNTFTKKHDFTLTGQSIFDMGIFPSGLIKGSNGKLYGATQFGVFEYNTTTNVIRTAGRFEAQGFAPSLLDVCRKPAYVLPASMAYSICNEENFTLDLASTNATTAEWKHDGVTDASQTTSALSFDAFSTADAGTWVCTLTNACGATVSKTITLTSGTPAAPVITAQGALTFCEGNSVTLSAPQGFTGYEWSNGATTQQITVSESGDYVVKVNNECISPLSLPATVTVHAAPPAPTAITAAGVMLTVQGGSGKYEWLLNDEILEEQHETLEVNVSGTYTVLSLSEEGCRSASFASFNYVCQKPTYVLPSSLAYSICNEEPFTIDLASTNATTAEWKHDGVTDASRTTSALSFDAFSTADAGTWVCTLTNVCGATVSKTITLTSGTPHTPVITAQGPLAFCEGNSVTLSAPQGFTGYEWSNGATTQQITVSESGNYFVKVNDECISPLSLPATVTVHATPPAPTAITATGAMFAVQGGSGKYEWLLNDEILEEQQETLEVNASGTYTVFSLSEEGCRSTSFASFNYVVTGTESEPGAALEIYPNPGTGIFFLKASKIFRAGAKVVVVNSTGQTVQEQILSAEDDSLILDLHHLAPGIYSVVVTTHQEVRHRKIIIR